MKSKIVEDLGRLFEVGFNIGLLTYIRQHKIKHKFANLYLEDLQQLKFAKMTRRIVDKGEAISTEERRVVESWSAFFLQKGFLSGLSFFQEYLSATGWNERRIEIVYYQCYFCDDNSIGTYPKGDQLSLRDVLSQFTLDNIERYIVQYTQKGEFLRADTLMLLQYRQQFRVLSVDLSVFSIQVDEEIKNPDNLEVLRRLLVRDISYLRSKSVFSNLRLDTGRIGTLGLDFSEGLQHYFTAFKYHDKESAKLIQAASYAHSFYEFLQETDILSADATVIFNVVGYSDRGISAITLSKQNRNILKTCYQIYKHDSSLKDITLARREVLNAIKRKAYGSFENGKKFVNSLLEVSGDQISSVSHKERVPKFFNSVDIVPPTLVQQLGLSGSLNLREAHAELITKALVSDSTYIFLTGNPGIGKTTAIANFLKSHLDEGFLFFYVSPRKQVNLDIINKFNNSETGELCDKRLFCINTYTDLIASNFDYPTVQYLSNNERYQGDFREQSVQFLDAKAMNRKSQPSTRLNRITEDVLQDAGRKTTGVLKSISEAIYTILNRQLSNNIVATVSIQSLKKTQNGKDTLEHFEKIFRDAYNKREDTVNPIKMREISRRIKHLFIMIDEITGDDSGVEFLSGISHILQRYQLTDLQHGFNTKVIVADASIVDSDVINQHLENTSPEPDKIYFRQVATPGLPLSVQPFLFQNLQATVINANSYPAGSLDITYKVFVESCQFREDASLQQKENLAKRLQAEILKDIEFLLERSDVEQVIVYIQDKRRLTELVESIKMHRQGEFEKAKDYLEIHANISDLEKQEIQDYKDRVKVIFMTASASRGLSFPKTRHILVEIPRFAIEKNLMEVIQVIYRGRGDEKIDVTHKELFFYLADKAIYDSDEHQQISIQESVLSLLNILLILKTSIMTRIFGSGNLGKENFLMIPIGGKSVSAAGDTFTGEMANLIRELRSEHRRRPAHQMLEQVYTSLEQLLGQAEFILNDPSRTRHTSAISYLSLRKSLPEKFLQLSNRLDELLNFDIIETGYLVGSLLIVPIADKAMQEKYQINSDQHIRKYATDELRKNMLSISYSPNYPDSLRFAVKGAIELVDRLKEKVDKTQRLEQNSQRFDQYYALPLFAFMAGETMNEYFQKNTEEPESARFRDILSSYVRAVYPVNDILPIGYKYQEFPFIVFSSYSLEQIRKKMFIDKYLFTSNEFNILNLILSQSG